MRPSIWWRQMRFNHLRRRQFITLLGGAAVAWSISTLAQDAGRTYRIAILSRSPRSAVNYVAFFDELRKLGFVEGQNLAVDTRGFGASSEQFPELAMELVKSNLDVLVCGSDAAIRAAQQATQTIPILGTTDDMVGSGLVHSLAKPGGHTTGMSILATELDGKRQEILMELLPGVRRMGALADPNTTAPELVHSLQDATRARGVELSVHWIAKPEEIVGAIDEAKVSGDGALNVLGSSLLNAHRHVIFERAAVLRLPAIYQWPETAMEGGLSAYGPRWSEIGRQNAEQLAKLLRGTKPAELPVIQPTRFELVVNLKTAKGLGLTISDTFLLRADKVIE
jgi:putative ABC transport system substrate-binding protein